MLFFGRARFKQEHCCFAGAGVETEIGDAQHCNTKVLDQMAWGVFYGLASMGTHMPLFLTSRAPCVTAVLVGGLFCVFEISGFCPFTFLEIMPVQEKCLRGFKAVKHWGLNLLNAGCFHLHYCMLMKIRIFG